MHLAWGGYGLAWQSMVDLAGAISLAADEAQVTEEAETGAAFVYPAGGGASSYDDELPAWL
ncbi:hypothetical protein [Streptosporangium sp. NPDC000396]|uniref:hypothetical protein n=1 Tax=Streptosporangium sp. NPDC000396 TaxID=3366185 RepID=UPI00368BF4FF